MGAKIWAALRTLNRAIPMGIALVLGILAFIVVFQTAVSSQIDSVWTAIFMTLVALFALWAPAVFVHELGHAIAATLVGWRTWVFCVGPIVVRFRPRLTFTWGQFIERDAGGYIWAAPKTEDANKRWRNVVVVLGGPIASLAGPFVTYPVALSMSGYVDPSMLAAFLFAFAVTSLGCAIVTIWPFEMANGEGNDAANIIAMLRSRLFDGHHPLAYAAALRGHGFADADFDPWIREAVEHAGKVETTISEDFLAAIANADISQAEAALQGLRGGSAEIMHAYLDAYVDNDPLTAEDRLLSTNACGYTSGWIIGQRLRELVLVAILASSNERDAARERLSWLEDALAKDNPAQPNWTSLIANARERYAL